MTSFPVLDRDRLDENQRAMWDHIALGPRGFYVGGPDTRRMPDLYNAWLQFPELGNAMLQLADAIRAHCELDGRSRELVVLIVSARLGSWVEFDFHTPLAKDQGIADDIIAAIRRRSMPEFANDRDGLVHDAVLQLLQTGAMDQTSRDAFVAEFGHAGLMQLVAAIGLYVVVSHTSNVADIRLAEDFDADPAQLANFYAGRS